MCIFRCDSNPLYDTGRQISTSRTLSKVSASAGTVACMLLFWNGSVYLNFDRWLLPLRWYWWSLGCERNDDGGKRMKIFENKIDGKLELVGI